MHDEKTLNWFAKNGLQPPSHVSHDVTPDNVRDRLKPLKTHSWRLEGNRLIAKTDMGELINYIDPGYIMTGTDAEGLPTFKKL